MAEYEAFRDIATPAALAPCSQCGRTFNPDTLMRHEKICASQKQRKKFDSSKKRLADLSSDPAVKRKPSPPPSISKQQKQKPSKDKSNWRAKHENLIATLKAARGEGPAVAPVVDPGYVECPYCSRNFNEFAAERHIPFCKEQKSRLPKQPTEAAKNKLSKRTQYKPPLPGAKKGSASSHHQTEATPKQRTPNRAAQNPSSGGIHKRSPAPSPGTRRRNIPDQSDYVDARALRRQASASPPPQRHNEFGKTKTLEKNTYNGKYKMRQQQQQKRNSHYRTSSGSSSDSDHHRVGSGKEQPAWLKGFKKAEDNSILPERKKSESSSAGSRGRHSGRQRETSKNDVFDFDEKPIKPARRPTQFDDDDFGAPMTRPTAVGVVRPSSRQTSDKEERTPSGRRKLANFCHDCGTKYPVATAKFCCECGVRRMHVEQI